MPANFWAEAALITTSGLMVAAGALVVGLIARAYKPKGEPLLPPWKPWRVPWSGFEVLGAFLFARLLPVLMYFLLIAAGFYTALYGPEFPAGNMQNVAPEQIKEANTIRGLWASMLALPLILALFWAAARSLYPKWKPAFIGSGSTAGTVWLAVVAWFAITPAVLVFHAIVNAIALFFNAPPENHPLTQLGNRPAMDQILFVLQACFAAPLIEEVLFRGVLLAWCIQRLKLSQTGVSPVTAARPWFVMVAVCVMAGMEWGQSGRLAPMVFAGVLAVGLAVVWRFKRTGARRARAVYATAALFAIVHSSVWPSPLPLFLLGLALGWLAARTNGILVPVIVHGLFNAVSAVFVLRSAGG